MIEPILNPYFVWLTAYSHLSAQKLLFCQLLIVDLGIKSTCLRAAISSANG